MSPHGPSWEVPLRRRTGPPGRSDPRGRETAWVPAPGTVAGRSAPGPAGGFPGPGQPLRRLPRPGQPPRPCEAVWSPVPPFKGRSDRLRPREAAEAALGGRRASYLPSGQGCPTARRDRAARRRSARLRSRRCPCRLRRRHRPRRCPTTGVPLRPEGRSAGGPFPVGRRPPRIGPAGEPPETAPGRGGGTWRLPVMAFVRTTASILRTQPPASVASCQRSFRVGAAGPRPSRRTAAWRTASWRTAAWQPLRGVLHNTPEVERGRAAPALRASDLPHRLYTAESARSSITVIGKVRRGPLQREAGTREGAPRGPPGIGAGIGGRPEPSSPVEQA
jgi:hypothetical protein